MIRYYYTKLKLFIISWRSVRSERKTIKLRTKLTKLQTMISAGFTNESEFQKFNKRLVENRKRELDPEQKKQLEEIRKKHYGDWKPKTQFNSSKDKDAQKNARQNEKNRSEYVRVIKNRPIVKNPNDTIKPSDVIERPL